MPAQARGGARVDVVGAVTDRHRLCHWHADLLREVRSAWLYPRGDILADDPPVILPSTPN
jgi:hypothetical protein